MCIRDRSLSLIISFKKLLNLLDAVSSKLFAIVNLVNGLYSNDMILNFLNGNTNRSII